MPPRTSIENEEAIVIPVTITGGEGGSEDGVGVVVGEGGNTGLLKRYSLVFRQGGIVIRLMGLGVRVST